MEFFSYRKQKSYEIPPFFFFKMRPQHAKLQLETHSYVPTENMWCIYQKEGHCWICCLTTSCILFVGTRQSSFYLIVNNSFLMGQFQLSLNHHHRPNTRIYRSAHTTARLLFQFNTNHRKTPLSPQDHKSNPERQKPLEIYSYISCSQTIDSQSTRPNA